MRSASDDQTHRTALKRFKHVASAEADLRTLELDDQHFAAGNSDNGWQWPTAVRKERLGVPGVVPARPCLTINKIAPPIAQLCNAAREARFAIEVRPKGAQSTRETAEVFQGLIRNCEVESQAQTARIWAFERALKCGRGFYRVLTKFANDGDSDLDIVTERILNQASVYLDPAAQQPDWSDAEWGFITVWMTQERYRREFPDSELASLDEFSGIGDDAPGWVRDLHGEKEVRIAEYFYATYTEVKQVDLMDGRSVPLAEAPPGVPVIRSRTIQQRAIKWCKLNAVEILDTQDWPGRYIPIIPVLGNESNVDGERIFEGLVRASKDAQRSYNYMRSAQVEGIGLAPRAPWIMADGQDAGYEKLWQESSTRNWPTLKYVPVQGPGGEPVPPPNRNVVEPAIQAITLAAHEATDDIHATTNVPPVSLGQIDPHDRSGKAIKALQSQSDQGLSNYLDNLARAIAFEGRIYVDLIPKVYTREGRIAHLLGTDDKASQVLLNQPFTQGPQGPQPSTAPEAQHYDLARGAYSVTVKVGKSYSTKREEAVAMMGDLATSAPQMVPMFADLWVDEMDFPGAHAISERLKKMLPPPLQESPQGNIPPAVQAQMQQMQLQMQQLQQQLQQASQIIQTEQVKQRAQVEKAQIDAASAIELQKMKDATAIAIAQINAATKGLVLQTEAANEAAALHQQQQHALGMAGMQQQHDAVMGQRQADAAQAQQGAAQQHEATMSEADRQQQTALAQHAAVQASTAAGHNGGPV